MFFLRKYIFNFPNIIIQNRVTISDKDVNFRKFDDNLWTYVPVADNRNKKIFLKS